MKLNLASGQRPFPEPWVNVDSIVQWEDEAKTKPYKLDIQTDIKDLSMIQSDSVDIMVLHHVVEHIAIHDLEAYISEWWRVLKQGGIMAVFVPNLRELDRAWIEGRISSFIHNVNTFGAYQGHVEDLHKWGYDFEELKNRLSGKNEQTGEIKFNWSQINNGCNLNNPMYQGANVARDWWILEGEFIK